MPITAVTATGLKCPKPRCEQMLLNPGKYYGFCPVHKTVEIRQIAVETPCAKGGAERERAHVV